MDENIIPLELRGIVSELKKKWVNIFLLETRDGPFIFRPLSRKEYLEILDLYNVIGDMAEEEVLSRCVLYPQEFDEDLRAGTISTVVDCIINISGFSDPEVFTGLLEENRKKMDLADSQMIILLLKAFPHLTLEKINNLDIQQLTYYLALAEQLLGNTVNITQEQNTNTRTKSSIDFEAENREMRSHGDAGTPFGQK